MRLLVFPALGLADLADYAYPVHAARCPGGADVHKVFVLYAFKIFLLDLADPGRFQ